MLRSTSGESMSGGESWSPSDSLGGEVGGEGAQYRLERERWLCTSGTLGARNDAAGAGVTGESGRDGGPSILAANLGKIQDFGPVVCRLLSLTPNARLIWLEGET